MGIIAKTNAGKLPRRVSIAHTIEEMGHSQYKIYIKYNISLLSLIYGVHIDQQHFNYSNIYNFVAAYPASKRK